jgi:DNA-binding transcriptional MerR regulator
MTVGELGQRAGLSRSALLYYDRLGLLKASGRSGSNYRLYTPADLERLEKICFYRKMGIPLEEVGRLVHGSQDEPTEAILRRRLRVLEGQIDDLQRQQHGIVRLLEQLITPRHRGRAAAKTSTHKETTAMKKERWVKIMEAAGFSEADRVKWHKTFEQMEPQEHQAFLESLGIPVDEIRRIRERSRQ